MRMSKNFTRAMRYLYRDANRHLSIYSGEANYIFSVVRYILSKHEPILSGSFYIVGMNRHEALHTRHVHYLYGL